MEWRWPCLLGDGLDKAPQAGFEVQLPQRVWRRKALLLMSPIRTLTVSPFLVPEPQDSSVQLPNYFRLQKAGCLLTKEKTCIFYQQPQLLELLIILRRRPQHSPENTMFLFLSFLSQKWLCSFSPLSRLSEGLYLLGLLCWLGAESSTIVSTTSMCYLNLN